jgi:xylulokinase
MRYLLGVDVGTTGTKAVLCDEQGTVRATATEEYPLYSPKPLWTEQEPEDWWRACVAAIGSVLGQANVEPGALAGIGLSGQQHGSVFLDADGQVIRRALLWNDQRTAAECAEINERVGAQRILELSGNAAMPGFTAPKILWLRNHEPQHYARVAHIVMPKDYIRYRLSGDLATDANEAAGTLLQETRTRAWSDEILYKLDIPRAWLPQICEGPELTGRVSAVGAAASGLPVGLPIAAGGGDNGAAAIGTGVIRPGTLSTSLGTSGVLFAYSDAPLIDPNGVIHTFCADVPGAYALIGVTLAAGGSLRWLRDTLRASGATHLSYEAMLHAAAEVPPGADGLLFLPYISGERMPVLDPLARGAFVGLTARHSYGHLVRAVLEGVVFALRDCFDLMQALGLPLHEAVAIGGGARSALWRQIQADVYGIPLVTLNVEEGPAYGAALLAGVGAGVFPSIEQACSTVLRVVARTEPDAERQQIYAAHHAIYRTLYANLRDALHGLAALTR